LAGELVELGVLAQLLGEGHRRTASRFLGKGYLEAKQALGLRGWSLPRRPASTAPSSIAPAADLVDRTLVGKSSRLFVLGLLGGLRWRFLRGLLSFRWPAEEKTGYNENRECRPKGGATPAGDADWERGVLFVLVDHSGELFGETKC